MSGAVKLLPCPFCGSDEIEGVIEETVRTWCARCGCDGPVDGSEQGVTWNTRAPGPAVAALEAEVARLRAALGFVRFAARAIHPEGFGRAIGQAVIDVADRALNPAPSENGN